MMTKENIQTNDYTPDSCPDLKICKYRCTKQFFKNVCSTKNFLRCHYFARQRKMLKTPINWIVSTVVEESIAFTSCSDQVISSEIKLESSDKYGKI